MNHLLDRRRAPPGARSASASEAVGRRVCAGRSGALPRRDGRRAGLDRRLRPGGGARRRPNRHPRGRRSAGHPSGFDPAAVRSARPRRGLRVHRAGDQRADAVVRHGARRLPRGAGAFRGRRDLRDRPQRDGLHRAAAGGVRGGHARGGDPGAVGGPVFPPGRPLPDQSEEDARERQGGDRRPSRHSSRRRSPPASSRSTSTRRRSWTSPSRRSRSSSASTPSSPRVSRSSYGCTSRPRCRSRWAARSARSERRTRRRRSFAPTWQVYRHALGPIRGLAKVSVQTGSSHGGMVAADGSVERVAIDFSVLKTISKVAREEFAMAGAVQHGASTLPPEYFGHFPDNDCAEIHLATDFMNTVYEHPAFPLPLKREIERWLDTNASDERKKGETHPQFLYKTRKKAIGPVQGTALESARGHARRDPRDARGEVPFPLHQAARLRNARARAAIRQAGLRPRRRPRGGHARRIRPRRPGRRLRRVAGRRKTGDGRRLGSKPSSTVYRLPSAVPR